MLWCPKAVLIRNARSLKENKMLERALSLRPKTTKVAYLLQSTIWLARILERKASRRTARNEQETRTKLSTSSQSSLSPQKEAYLRTIRTKWTKMRMWRIHILWDWSIVTSSLCVMVMAQTDAKWALSWSIVCLCLLKQIWRCSWQSTIWQRIHLWARCTQPWSMDLLKPIQKFPTWAQMCATVAQLVLVLWLMDDTCSSLMLVTQERS